MLSSPVARVLSSVIRLAAESRQAAASWAAISRESCGGSGEPFTIEGKFPGDFESALPRSAARVSQGSPERVDLIRPWEASPAKGESTPGAEKDRGIGASLPCLAS